MKQLEEHKISTWREMFKEDNCVKPFVSIDPTERFFINKFTESNKYF